MCCAVLGVAALAAAGRRSVENGCGCSRCRFEPRTNVIRMTEPAGDCCAAVAAAIARRPIGPWPPPLAVRLWRRSSRLTPTPFLRRKPPRLWLPLTAAAE